MGVTQSNPEKFQIHQVRFNSFLTVQRDLSYSPQQSIEFVSDPDLISSGSLTQTQFQSLLSIEHQTELKLDFDIQINQPIHGLSFVVTGSSDGLDKLLNRDRRLDPNLSNRSNVILVDQAVSKQKISFQWSFLAPPDSHRPNSGGFRLFLAFVSFQPNLDKFIILSSFSIFVRTKKPPIILPTTTPPLPSSSISNKKNQLNQIPKSITAPNLNSSHFPSSTSTEPFKLLNPHLDFKDSPLFRAKLAGLERRSGHLKKALKSIIRTLETYHDALATLIDCEKKLDRVIEQLDDASPASYRPLKETYIQAAQLYTYALHSDRLQRLQLVVLQPLRRVYNKLKESDHAKKTFEQEAKTYYDYMVKYLAIRPDQSASDSSGSKEAKAMDRFQILKTKFTLARVDYHHRLYDLAIFQESHVLQILTDYQILQHELLCADTDLSKQLGPLGNSLRQLQRDLGNNHVEIDIQKASLEEHRRYWETKLASLSLSPQQQDIVLDNLETEKHQSRHPNQRSSIQLPISKSFSPPKHQQARLSLPPITLSSPIPSPPISPSTHDQHCHQHPHQHQHKPHEPLGEKLLRTFVSSLAGFSFQRTDASSSFAGVGAVGTSLSSDECAVSSGIGNNFKRRIKTSLHEPFSTGLTPGNPSGTASSACARSSSLDLPQRDISKSTSLLTTSARYSSTSLDTTTKSNTLSAIYQDDADHSEEEILDIRTPSQLRKKEGFLHTSSTKSLTTSSHHHSSQNTSSSLVSQPDTTKSWKRFWCVLSNGQLSEYTINWKSIADSSAGVSGSGATSGKFLESSRPPINLRFATVRLATRSERRFCFEVITVRDGKRTFQATSDAEALDWVRAIGFAIESLLNGTSSVRNFDFSKFHEYHERSSTEPSDDDRTLEPQRQVLPLFGTDLPNKTTSYADLMRVNTSNHQNSSVNSSPFGKSLANRLIRKGSAKLSQSPAADKAIRNRFTTASKSKQQQQQQQQSGGGGGAIQLLGMVGKHSAGFKSMSHVPQNSEAGGLSPSSTSLMPLPLLEKTATMVTPGVSLGETGCGLGSSEPSGGNRPKSLEETLDASIVSAVLTLAATSTTITSLATNNNTTPRKAGKKCDAEKNLEELNFLSELKGNDGKCGECGKRPARWASYSLGVFLCIRCSGIHRGLGTHISKVRSLDLDDWSDEQMKLMRSIGNSKAKSIWEATLPSGFKVTDQNVAEFIRDKYALGRFKHKEIVAVVEPANRTLPIPEQEDLEPDKNKMAADTLPKIIGADQYFGKQPPPQLIVDQHQQQPQQPQLMVDVTPDALRRLVGIGVGSGSFIFEI